MNNTMSQEEFKNLPEETKRALMWYFHPNETIRMLRYFQLTTKLDTSLDMSPNYPDNPTIGVVIGTYGSTAFIQLQLYYLTVVNKIKKVLIHDDCSPNQNQLKALAKKYNVDFYSTPKNMFYKECVGSIGDQNTFFQGLLWAKQNNIDILVKLSRRLIPCENWSDNLIKLAKQTDAIAFTSWCEKDQFNCRTEGIALSVNVFSQQYPLYNFQHLIENNICIFAEYWMHELIKSLSYQNKSEKWKKYIENNNFGYKHSGYAVWQDFLGTNRYNADNRTLKTLWHMYSSANDYLQEANKYFPNKYTETDFKV